VLLEPHDRHVKTCSLTAANAWAFDRTAQTPRSADLPPGAIISINVVGAARQRRLARRLIVIRGVGAHERQVDVDVRVMNPGKTYLPRASSDFGPGATSFESNVRLDPRDRFVLA